MLVSNRMRLNGFNTLNWDKMQEIVDMIKRAVGK